MSKTNRPLTVADAHKAMDAAQAAIDGTDGLVLVLLVARQGEDGPEVFTPSIHPAQFDRELLKTIVAGYSKALTAIPKSGGVRVAQVPLPGTRKGTVN